MEALQGLAEALEASSFGAWARGAWPYPAANLVHLLGMVLVVGGIGLLDLRLAGLFQALPLAAMSRILTPAALVGLALMVPSGSVMFAADAGALAQSNTLRLKLALVTLAIVNAIAFRVIWRRRMPRWDANPPALGRAMAGLSVGLWLGVAALGRMIAYT